MRIGSASSLVLTASVAAFASLPALASGLDQSDRTLGYRDSNGVFHSLSAATPEAGTPATTGTVDVTLTIKLASTFAAGTTFSCSAFLDGLQVTSTGTVQYTESEAVVATVTGATAKCVIAIPYSWVLMTTSLSESFTGQYTVSAIQIPPSGSTAAGITSRSSSSTFVSSTTIPSTGTISKYTVSVTL
jgi:hypothetical protein